MYVIRHNPTFSIFGIRKNDESKTRICCFPNVNHANRVADNIARFHYAQNCFFSEVSEYYKRFFMHPAELECDNLFTPFEPDVDATSFNLVVQKMDGAEIVEHCGRANMNIAFCIITDMNNREMHNNVFMFDMDINDDAFDRVQFMNDMCRKS